MRWKWFLVVALIVVVAGGTVAWFTGHQAAGQPSVQPSAPPLTASQAVSLMNRLTSGNSAEVTSAIAMPGGQQVPASTVRGLRTLAPITADIGSFREVAPSVATLSATDHTRTTWLLHLVWMHSAWLVLDSVKQ